MHIMKNLTHLYLKKLNFIFFYIHLKYNEFINKFDNSKK